MYIYHHLITILLLLLAYNSEHSYEYMNLFHLGELSNFFNYIVYHLIKSKYSIVLTSLIKVIQLVWFSYIRIYLLLFIGYEYSFIFNSKVFITILWIIYVLVVVWSIKQYFNLKKNINNFFK